MSRDQTTPYSVSVEGDRTLQAIVGAVLSSLPRTYSRLEGAVRAPVDVVAVAGGGEWADAAVQAIDAGVRGVIVIEPSPVALPGVDRLAEKAGAQRAVVRLARRWAGDPAVVPFSRARAVGGGTTLVDSRIELPGGVRPGPAAVAQIDLVQTALKGTVEIESAVFLEDSYVATGRLVRGAHSDLLLLSGASSMPFRHRASVRELLLEGRRSLAIGDGETARAAVASVGDREGTRILPPVYETGYRAAWRALAADLDESRASGAAGGAPPLSDLAEYRHALTAAQPILENTAR
ncbi:hypothetical protein QSU92_06210 [Microbacterium sp. ET2]|uniref:hypothetical protein n=1 Tax=Microbacterium albipurpureum TaxID=3050384 RepID=UPI00259C8D2B|nr:hypothetical protein [Microbacterium sp. ET2 (Ac-2212)]WJL96765.1 hypothetical protein QSU92_06210 [Microbacterium sp. ET2 (Ac-2212)]